MKHVGLALLLVACLMVLQGCGGPSGPPVGQVMGTVTLDGKPVPGARVTFEPAKGAAGAPAGGRTDGQGKYELWTSKDRKGAAPGNHTVRIETDPNPDPETGKTPPPLPAKFNAQSKLTAEVKAGSNTIDFPLTSSEK